MKVPIKITPECRTLMHASNYLDRMHIYYVDMFGSQTELSQYYENGHVALKHHLFEVFLKYIVDTVSGCC